MANRSCWEWCWQSNGAANVKENMWVPRLCGENIHNNVVQCQQLFGQQNLPYVDMVHFSATIRLTTI